MWAVASFYIYNIAYGIDIFKQNSLQDACKRTFSNRRSFFVCKRMVVQIEKIVCRKCGQTLLKAEYVKGEIKCPRCRQINKLEISVKEYKGKSQ